MRPGLPGRFRIFGGQVTATYTLKLSTYLDLGFEAQKLTNFLSEGARVFTPPCAGSGRAWVGGDARSQAFLARMPRPYARRGMSRSARVSQRACLVRGRGSVSRGAALFREWRSNGVPPLDLFGRAARSSGGAPLEFDPHRERRRDGSYECKDQVYFKGLAGNLAVNFVSFSDIRA